MAENDPFSFHFDRGDVFLPDAGLWLDPKGPRDFAFVSHAHGDHYAPHGRILCSPPTRRLIEARFGASTGQVEIVAPAFGETTVLGGCRVQLLPAGHIAGSAMLFLERLADGATLLHTGDCKSRPSEGSETQQLRPAGTLVMETTFGLPRYRFPPAEEVLRDMVRFALEAIEDGGVPIFMAYALGKAQEILIELHARDPERRFQVHESVARMNEVVRELGYDLPHCELFEPAARSPAEHIVVLPPGAARSLAVRRMGAVARLAMVSGWGMDPAAKFRYRCEEVFPLSDHADYDELLALVEAVSPRHIHTIHGFTEEFAADLRRRGHEAWPLVGETQRELDMLLAAPSQNHQTGPRGEDAPLEAESEFEAFALVCGRIAEMSGRSGKRRTLAAYLSSLDEVALPLAVRFLSAQPLARGERGRATGVGAAGIRQALLDVGGISLRRLREISASQADLGRTAYLVLQGRTVPKGHTLGEVATLFRALSETRDQGGKVRLLAAWVADSHPAAASIAIGILTGDLRIGLKEGLVEEAVAEAFGADLAEVREANMLLGDLGETATLARAGELRRAGLTWFTPLRVMLASPEETAEAIFERLGGEGRGVWLEDKFDGIRAQLHLRGDEAELYSRDLRPLSGEFPELVEAARAFDRDLILDGEIIAWAEGRRLSFFDLQKRLGRHDLRLEQGDLFFGMAVPVRFVAFDLLGLDGEGWIKRPLSERRAGLEGLALPRLFDRVAVFHAENAEEIAEIFRASRRRGNEGLVAKDPASGYTPGRRGKQWLKLKSAMPTLDVVVVKAQQGHGKRAHVLSDYTFAVRDEASGGLRVVGKAYSGLTDLEIEELTDHFQRRTLQRRRGVHEVEPDVVLEIAFDSIRPSKRHDSGLAMRFPRIKAIRRDKTVADIDTLEWARSLAGLRPGE